MSRKLYPTSKLTTYYFSLFSSTFKICLRHQGAFRSKYTKNHKLFITVDSAPQACKCVVKSRGGVGSCRLCLESSDLLFRILFLVLPHHLATLGSIFFSCKMKELDEIIELAIDQFPLSNYMISKRLLGKYLPTFTGALP